MDRAMTIGLEQFGQSRGLGNFITTGLLVLRRLGA